MLKRNEKFSLLSKNNLQSYINEARENIESNKKLSKDVKVNLLETLQVESSWLDDNDHLDASEYVQHLNNLKKQVDSFLQKKEQDEFEVIENEDEMFREREERKKEKEAF